MNFVDETATESPRLFQIPTTYEHFRRFPDTSVCVSDLSYFCDENDLYSLFKSVNLSQITALMVCRGMNFQPNRPLYYGFVQLPDPDSVNNAITLLHGRLFQGRYLSVTRYDPNSRMDHRQKGHIRFKFDSRVKLDRLSEDLVRVHFERIGPLADVVISKHFSGPTGTAHGFGFLSYKRIEDAEQSIVEMHHTEIDEIVYSTEWSKSSAQYSKSHSFRERISEPAHLSGDHHQNSSEPRLSPPPGHVPTNSTVAYVQVPYNTQYTQVPIQRSSTPQSLYGTYAIESLPTLQPPSFQAMSFSSSDDSYHVDPRCSLTQPAPVLLQTVLPVDISDGRYVAYQPTYQISSTHSNYQSPSQSYQVSPQSSYQMSPPQPSFQISTPPQQYAVMNSTPINVPSGYAVSGRVDINTLNTNSGMLAVHPSVAILSPAPSSGYRSYIVQVPPGSGPFPSARSLQRLDSSNLSYPMSLPQPPSPSSYHPR